jgi:signal transduction histidine kinase
LSTSRDIMLRHGGRLELRSAPGMGCEVSLWFPVRPVSDK